MENNLNLDWIKNKNVLITGINGFVGSKLAERLFNICNVTGLIQDKKKLSTIDYLGLNNKINIVEGSINNYELIMRVLSKYEINYIFHLAAYSIVKLCSKAPSVAHNINIMGTVNILEAMRVYGNVTGCVCASSDKAYGDHNILPYKEDFALQALNTYDASKACSDIIARSYAHNYNLPICVTRCSNIYGPGDMNLTRIIPGSILRILSGQRPVLYNGVEKYKREFIYIDDVVNAYLYLMKDINSTRKNAFNVGINYAISIGNMMDEIIRTLGVVIEPELIIRDKDFKEIEEQRIDYSLIKKITDWEPKYSLKEGLKLTIDWYKQFYETGLNNG